MANKELGSNDPAGKFDCAVIYDQASRNEIRKDGIGQPWIAVREEET